MKHALLIILLSIFGFCHTQTIEDKLESIALKVSSDFKNRTDYKIAVYPFTQLKDNEKELSLLVFDEFHIAIQSKTNTGFSVIDRATIETYLEEHKLNSEGLINPDTAKEFGQLIAADAYVTGKVFIFGSIIKLVIKLTDTETGEIISYNSEKLPIDYDMAQFLGMKDWKEKQEKAEENKSQNSQCRSLNIGDYCFKNNTDIPVEIRLLNNSRKGYSKKLRLQPQLKTCFKDLKTGSHSYGVYKMEAVGPATRYDVISQGDFSIKTCEAKIQDIVSSSSPYSSNGEIKNKTNQVTIAVKIINPNYYSRRVKFRNSKGETESIIVGSQSESEIQLTRSTYGFISQTTYSNHTCQKGSFRLRANYTLKLVKDDFN